MRAFATTPTGFTANGRPIMVSEIIASVKGCRVCNGTNLVAWGLWVPPARVHLFTPDGTTAPEGKKRSLAHGLCRICFDLHVDDEMPLQWVSR